MQADRRRFNPPPGDTAPPVFNFATDKVLARRPQRSRKADEHRKIFLQTGIVPSASGSAYYEIQPPATQTHAQALLLPDESSVKITCTVHGPRPLPRNAAFSPNLLLSTHVKFAPFGTRVRRGYVRDSNERDLGAHLETALRGVVIGERWPKSSCEVVITILEGEDEGWWGDKQGAGLSSGLDMMNVLAGCITVSSAALVDAGIDCVDMVSGGVAASVQDAGTKQWTQVIDPSPSEHEKVKAACVVGLLQSRNELTEVWMKGDVGQETEELLDGAVKAAELVRTVLVEAVKENLALKLETESIPPDNMNGASKDDKNKDVFMTG